MTEDRSDLVLYNCEAPDTNYSKDQQWSRGSSGRLINRLSKKCMDIENAKGFADGHTRVIQRNCTRTTSVVHSDQAWEFLPNGLLKHQRLGGCVDAKMHLRSCPVNTQRWVLKDNGLIRNEEVGDCLDVQGFSGEEPRLVTRGCRS